MEYWSVGVVVLGINQYSNIPSFQLPKHLDLGWNYWNGWNRWNRLLLRCRAWLHRTGIKLDLSDSEVRIDPLENAQGLALKICDINEHEQARAH